MLANPMLEMSRKVEIQQSQGQGLKQLIERREIYIHLWVTIINHKLVNNNNSNSKITVCLIILTVVLMDLG